MKFGDYRYSLKPGIAPSGDQLDYFLFDAKKGYCSYFAFAFASLLRSINIPCRIAVGFFLEPEEGRLDFYPVRSNMAHAWVEVWFPGFGWIECDPTTEKLAEDEEFEFSKGIPPELFERLMREIIDNYDRLKIKESAEGKEEGRALAAAARAAAFIKKSFVYIALVVMAGAFVVIRFGYYIRARFSKNPRKKTLRLWRHIKRRLKFAGVHRAEAESEWVDRVMTEYPGAPLRALYDNVSAAKYAEYYAAEGAAEFFALYETFSLWYKKHFSPFKKLKKHDAAKPLVFIFCVFLFSSNVKTYTEENDPGAEEHLSMALTAENNEYWMLALEMYKRGKADYPFDYRFPLRLGSLYFDRELYRLAMDELLIANRLAPDDTQILYRLAQTAGNLNENRLAAAFLENLLALDPANHEAIGSLGWMYFKLHRLRDGEKLLSDAIERFGADIDFYMTLGTIYSAMFNYEEAKRYYLDAVNGALSLGGAEFASVAYYNLSILESRFYRYRDAFSSTTSSLLLSNRSSGHLSRGELMMRRLDFNEVFSEYNTAYEMDKSQLSKLSLAQAFLASGDLEQARLYAEDCLTSNNLYWMLNYGIDPDQYKRDLHEILYSAYSGLEKKEKLTARYGLPDAARGLALRVSCYFKYRVHKLLYQKYALLSAGAFEESEFGSGGRHLEALFQYCNAFYDYNDRALDYLKAAEDFELRLIPEAAHTYLFETGKLTRNMALLNEALSGFDPVWEKDLTADAYAEIALAAKEDGRPELAAEAAGRLFALNPGALRQNGVRLPVNLEISGEAFAGGGRANAVQKTLREAGFDTKPPGVPRWSLRLYPDGAGTVSAELYDSGSGRTSFRKTLPLASFSAKQLCQFANALAAEAFNSRSQER